MKNRIKRHLFVNGEYAIPTYPPIPQGMGGNPHLHIIQKETVAVIIWTADDCIYTLTFNLASGANSTWTITSIRRR